MLRTLTIAGIAAIAMAAAPIAAPEAEARSNLDNFLIGATAIAILGGIAASQRRSEPVVTKRYVEPRRQDHHSRGHDHSRGHNHGYKNVVVTKTFKPKHCLRQKWSHGRWVTFYGQKCLAKHTTTHVYQSNR